MIAQQALRRQLQLTARTPLRTTTTRTVPRQVVRQQRYNSTRATDAARQAGNAAKQETSPLVAGMAGGLVTLVGGYAWYHFSGTKKVVQTARKTIETFESTKEGVKEKSPSPSEVLNFIRSTTQYYLSSIPGAGPAIDAAFRELDEVSETHGEEVNKLLRETYEELRQTLEKGGLDKQTGQQVSEIMKRRAKQMKELTKDVGQKVLEDNPKLKEQIGSGIDQLKQLGKTYGPEAQKIVDETYREVQDIANQGLSPSGIAKATSLVREKTQKVKELGTKGVNKAWDDGYSEMRQYMDKLPSGVKEVLDENMDKVKYMALSGGISTSTIPYFFERIKDVSQGSGSQDEVQQFREFMEEITKKGQSKLGSLGQSFGSGDSDGWQQTIRIAKTYIRSIPGGDKALQETPNLDEFVNLTRKHGPEAENLARETIQEISDILNKKLEEAKKLARESNK